MLITAAELNSFKKEVGEKTWNLKLLTDLNLPVPFFFALPSSVVARLQGLNTGNKLYQDLMEEIKHLTSASRFAVRSSAFLEDSQYGSQAGQFLTKIDVKIEQVPSAIAQVIDHAVAKLGSAQEFSIIVQEYIAADFAGVCFTRNPQGSRDMVIEYHQGIGEDLVSGKTRPTLLSQFWNQPVESKWLIPAIEMFKQIERQLSFPQDIEWVMQGNVIWILQARPITTLTELQFKEFLYLDTILPQEKFLYEKSEISEIAPRPTPFTFSLLEQIYAQGGPVDRVYAAYGIEYKPKNSLEIIGNELYANREEELKTLLPAYSYFPNGKPHLSRFKNVWTTVKNIFNLQRLSLKKYDSLFKKLQQLLEESLPHDANLVPTFLEKYQVIFEINLLAAKALQSLDGAAKRDHLSTAALLELPVNSDSKNMRAPDEPWVGNSLEITDESHFSSSQSHKKVTHNTKILDNLSRLKQAYYLPLIQQAQSYSKLREYGRWLTVKYMHHIRQHALQIAGESGYQEVRMIYFAKISELGKVTEKTLQEREKDYISFNSFQLPARLTNITLPLTHSLLGVSSGRTQGVLQVPASLASSKGNIILYTKALSPDLVKYFPKISGIISEQGGLLSHLAILAREQGLPVIVIGGNQKYHPGQEVVMDADLGAITVVK